MGAGEQAPDQRPNGARGWDRVRRTYAITLAVVLGWLALLALLLVIWQLTRWPWLHPMALVAYALTIVPFAALLALGYWGLHSGVGVAPLLAGLGLVATFYVGWADRPWPPLLVLAVLPGLAALLTHPRRRPRVGQAQVRSAAR